jgi:hypothetical protein
MSAKHVLEIILLIYSRSGFVLILVMLNSNMKVGKNMQERVKLYHYETASHVFLKFLYGWNIFSLASRTLIW